MDEERNASQVSWGARINTRERHDAKDCPDWTNPADRKRWAQTGLIIWQNQTQRIIGLSATDAIQILDNLRTDDSWKEQGIIVGQPVLLLPRGKQGHAFEPGLHNPIHLSPRQTKMLARLLERNLGRLEDMREQEEREQDQAREEFVRVLADICLRSMARESTPDESSVD